MRRTKRTILGLVLFIIIISSISLQASLAGRVRINLISILKFPLRIASNISYNIRDILRYKSFSEENKKLRKKIDSLTAEKTELKEASIENIRLRGLLALKQKVAYNVIAAVVIGRDSSNWSNTIIIDKGKNNNIKINMPVVSSGGLIGKVIEVGPNTSRIILITDPGSRVAALIQENREEGVVCGGIKGRCRMNYLPLNTNTKAGETVISSGSGGVYPKGLLIGTVFEVKEESSQLYRYAEILPAADLSRLEEVLCIVR